MDRTRCHLTEGVEQAFEYGVCGLRAHQLAGYGDDESAELAAFFDGFDLYAPELLEERGHCLGLS